MKWSAPESRVQTAVNIKINYWKMVITVTCTCAGDYDLPEADILIATLNIFGADVIRRIYSLPNEIQLRSARQDLMT
jgi:hypothetical protein